MSDLGVDIGSLYGTKTVGDKEVTIAKKGSNSDLDMLDFITLMIAQMSNQGIDDTMDTSEMLNQMVQMQMITSMVNMTDATTMNYAASLVGQTVTIGVWNEETKQLEDFEGVVEGTGTYNGQQVIFVNGKSYYLSDIMAVGKLPPKVEEKPGEGEDNNTDGTDTDNNTDGTNNNTDGTNTDNNTDTEGGDNSGASGGAAG